MLCEHLQPLEAELKAAGVPETFRGQAWSSNCREWVYFSCFLDLPSIRRRLKLSGTVTNHSLNKRFQGEERGFVCSQHHDAIMGFYEEKAGSPVIK